MADYAAIYLLSQDTMLRGRCAAAIARRAMAVFNSDAATPQEKAFAVNRILNPWEYNQQFALVVAATDGMVDKVRFGSDPRGGVTVDSSGIKNEDIDTVLAPCWAALAPQPQA